MHLFSSDFSRKRKIPKIDGRHGWFGQATPLSEALGKAFGKAWRASTTKKLKVEAIHAVRQRNRSRREGRAAVGSRSRCDRYRRLGEEGRRNADRLRSQLYRQVRGGGCGETGGRRSGRGELHRMSQAERRRKAGSRNRARRRRGDQEPIADLLGAHQGRRQVRLGD